MYFVLSPIHYIKSRGVYMKQKRTALHSITAFRARPTPIKHPRTPPIPSQPDNRNVALNTNQAWQWTCNLSSVIVQFAKKPVVLPCTKQLDV